MEPDLAPAEAYLAMEKLGRIIHGVYTILATYLLGWVIYFAVLAFGFHLATEWAIGFAGFDRPEIWWQYIGSKIGLSGLALRLPIYVLLHAAVLFFGWGVLERIKMGIERAFDGFHRRFLEATDGHPRIRTTVRGLFTAAVTLVLVPFVLQPTLVGTSTSSLSWAQRAANLADGTASTYVIDSVVGEYRKWFVESVDSVGGVEPDDIEPSDSGDKTPADPPPTPEGDRPMMDRWNETIGKIAERDPEWFARLKAVMWVESGGRQFAVSHTGCAGLMQFCSGTARTQPFRSIFGTGTVYSCNCDDRCSTPEELQRALESGSGRPPDADARFPCELSDARFDPEKSLRAAEIYLKRLAGKFGGNLYLMYVGYNSGPAVAKRVWRRLGENPDAGLTEIEPHLAEAMRPYFPDSATSRARSLLQTHLPKLKDAYDRYRREARESLAAGTVREGSAQLYASLKPSSLLRRARAACGETTPVPARPPRRVLRPVRARRP